MRDAAFLAWSLGLTYLSFFGRPKGDPCTFYIPIWAANLLVYVGWGIVGNIMAWLWLLPMGISMWLAVRQLIRDHRAGRHGPPRPPRRRRLRLALRRPALGQSA